MTDYNCKLRSSVSEEETAVSSPQALAHSYEAMWEGWSQMPSSTATQSGNCAKNVNSYDEQGLLPASWTIPGFQGQDAQQRSVSVYRDGSSRRNICSSTLDLGGGPSDPSSHQLYTPLQNCKSTLANSGRPDQQSALEFKNNTVISDLQSHGANPNHETNLTVLNNDNEHLLQHISTADLNSGKSSNSCPTAGLPFTSFGQKMQHIHRGQYDVRTVGWTDASSSHQTDGQQEHFSCGDMILHDNRCKEEADEVFFDTGTNLTEEMYAELHGLLTKNVPTSDEAAAEEQHHLVICSNKPDTSGNCEGDHSGLAQFSLDVPGASGSSLTAVVPFNMQPAAQLMMFSPETLTTVGRKMDDSSSPLSAGTAISSTYHNLHAIAAAHGHGYNLYESSDLIEISEFQKKRPCEDQRGQSSSNADESLKRSCIALFGRAPANYLLGTTTNSAGSVIDMNSAVGPALNTNGRPRARRGSATDPQSVYARNRRERIKDRLKILQQLVPNGAKVDIVTMLEEAINYVRFLQLQVRLLSSDELWIYAPTTYNGVDVSMGLHEGLYQNQEI